MPPGNQGAINQLYNNYALRKKSAVQALTTAYNNRVAMQPANLGTGNQLYGNDYTLAKKFSNWKKSILPELLSIQTALLQKYPEYAIRFVQRQCTMRPNVDLI